MLVGYSGLIVLALWLSLQIRFDFSVEPLYSERFLFALALVLPVKLAAFGFFRQFGSLLTFFSLPDAKRIFLALAVSSLVLLAVWFFSGGSWMLPRGVLVIDFVISLLVFFGMRTGLRIVRERSLFGDRQKGAARNVAIIGAGESGSALFREIQSKQGLNLRVVCFVDDDPSKIGGTLHGREILGPIHKMAKIADHLDISKAIIAMPNAKSGVIRDTVAILNASGIEHDILPTVSQILHHQVSINFLRTVNPEDLLGRPPVTLDEPGLREMLRGGTVMVTGAGGSIGSELCRQIAFFNPERLVLVERSEPALFSIEQELKNSFPYLLAEPCATSVCNRPGLAAIFEKYRPSVVFHAAAHKHVPLMEKQPAEALINNCLGTWNTGSLAAAAGCKKAVLVSTDKAVNPTNVMGATKRVAEMVWAELQDQSPAGGCCFSAVRFGNVLGSSGSVIPIFRKQISAGGPVTVTHPEVTRFFMSIPEAAGLILQSAFQSSGGEIFVLDMGDPIKISDMARQMIELCGLRPDEDIKIVFTGLRPGEKLFEETIHSAENVTETGHKKIMLLRPEANRRTSDMVRQLQTLCEGICSVAPEAIKESLHALVPEYKIWKNG